MFSLIFAKLADPRTVLAIIIGIITVASLIVLVLPYLDGDNLDERMKTVSIERERIRAREREKMMTKGNNNKTLRHSSKTYMKDVVDRFSLSKWLATEEAKTKLAKAGYRGPQAEIGFLFFRLVSPIGLMLSGSLYCFVVLQLDMSWLQKFAVVVGLLYLGLKAPEIYLGNKVSKRQLDMRRAFPDALDLLLICIESGMSIEHGFRKVIQEIGVRSIALAEEFTLTTAELSYLPDRRSAYDNFYLRTGLDDVKNVVTSLVQAEKYGTPLGTALRTVSQEARDNRMMEAEKKAASLPPKLTVPMILFFLPVLFAVIMTPAVMQVTGSGQ
jgi:tight adherence protein C